MLTVSIAIGVGLVLVCVLALYAALRLLRNVPNEDRTWLDALPLLLRFIWPIVNFLAHYSAGWFSERLIERTNAQLRLTSLNFLMNARQFLALSMVSSFGVVLVASIVMLASGLFSAAVLCLAMCVGFFYPRIWMRDVRRRHVATVLRQLPIYLDFLTLAVEAGLNINGAIQKAVEKGPDGPLRREFEHVLRDLKSGLNRSDALRRFDERQRIGEVSNLVRTIAQAERMGSGLAKTLRFQSGQRRAERFQRAEKQAMEAPVKLVFPLLVFIFPVTFIVLFFPIAMKFMQEGLL
ncbi:type II secretion system F family protein [Paraburkholderia sp. Tr-20389]|uniref:type II secretion system F family protein n=1 Tax=Paraburkholderia sp. Tr-20389 TaxID=2703903 RepID=UPI001980963F|nr:type II secretion system F family protein [Paraburkholderia sp. Tr-20389]MBN3752461.1 type II secretion system F family protein [Paraburkholderia sp. Tr-20389]